MYRDILVCINEAEGRDNAIHAAASFANEHNASLTGLYVVIDEVPIISPYGGVVGELGLDAIKRQEEKAAKAKESFLQISDSLKCSATWLEVNERDHPLQAIVYTDLVVTNQVAYDPRQGSSNRGFINSLVLETGKPVVLIPTDWKQPLFGSRIVLGWDESREAVRAMQDSMPLLKLADRVDAVAVNYKAAGEISDVSEISTYLTQRNVNCHFHLANTGEQLDTPEKVLLDFVDKNSSDLVVIGGYGHTRLREIILGGVTRFMIKSSAVPVLLSH